MFILHSGDILEWFQVNFAKKKLNVVAINQIDK